MGPSYTYSGKAVAVHDGDTYTLELDVGFNVIARVKVRLHGWSCPELGTADGDRARVVAARLLLPPDGPVPLVAKTYKGQTFGRWVADLYLGNKHLGELLEAAGVARKGAFEG